MLTYDKAVIWSHVTSWLFNELTNTHSIPSLFWSIHYFYVSIFQCHAFCGIFAWTLNTKSVVIVPCLYFSALSSIMFRWVNTRDVPNIHFVFASVLNSAPNSVHVFVFGWRVSSEQIRIVSLYMYSEASDVYGRLHSVSATCPHCLILGDEWRGEGHG